MSLLDSLERLKKLKEGLVEAEESSDVQSDAPEEEELRLFLTENGELAYRDLAGVPKLVQTVSNDSGFSRFVFDIEGAFPLIADSAKDAVNIRAGQGIGIFTDPSTDSMEFSIKPQEFLIPLGNGASVLTPDGELRTLVAGNNLQITEKTEEILFEVQLDATNTGAGTSVIAGLSSSGKLALRSIADTSTVKVSVNVNDELSLQAVPNLVNVGAGYPLSSVNANGEGEISTIVSKNSNISITVDSDGTLALNAIQQFFNIGSGLGVVDNINSSGTWGLRTLRGGDRASVTIEADGTLLLESQTSLVNTGTGVQVGSSTGGVGYLKTLRADDGISLIDDSTEIGVKAEMRVSSSGDGVTLGEVDADGLLTLKTLKSADTQIYVREESGAVVIEANPDDYLLDAKLQDALDGSGDEVHLVLTTNRNLDIDAGPVPFVRAFYVTATDVNGDPVQEIHVYNRNSFVGKLPPDNPDNLFVSSLEGDLYNDMAGVEAWDTTDDLSQPPNQIIHVDLGA